MSAKAGEGLVPGRPRELAGFRLPRPPGRRPGGSQPDHPNLSAEPKEVLGRWAMPVGTTGVPQGMALTLRSRCAASRESTIVPGTPTASAPAQTARSPRGATG